MKRCTITIAVAMFLLANAMAFDVESTSLHLYLAGIQTTERTSVREGFVIFALAGPYRSVGVAFLHESFSIIHAFERNRNGVLVMAYPVPPGMNEDISYRYVVDGVWARDPSNPDYYRDSRSGVQVSTITVPFLSSERPGTYRLIADDGKTAQFLFRGEPGCIVTVCGDFSEWDPFLYELAETEPGLYRLDLTLPSGLHRYTFMYQGDRIADPLNPRREYTPEGSPVSVIVIPGT